MKLGSVASEQLSRLARSWKQGEHVLLSGGTGSGKTLLASYLDNIRVDKGGSVVVFICKLNPDETIAKHYSRADGWVRWKTWHKHPKPTERKILLWPAVEGKTAREAESEMVRVFSEALDEISRVGKWTVHIDEGLYMCGSLGFGSMLSTMASLIRSSKGTMVFLVQRPSHIPLAIYSNLSHAFVSHAAERGDLIRLANLDSTVPSRELASMIQSNRKHDFTWIPVGHGQKPERLNLAN